MALDATALGNAIATSLKSSDASAYGAVHAAAMASFYDFVAAGIAAGIVAHFQSNAVIDPGGVPAMTSNGVAVVGKGKVL